LVPKRNFEILHQRQVFIDVQLRVNMLPVKWAAQPHGFEGNRNCGGWGDLPER
jgi:hypothetical protein